MAERRMMTKRVTDDDNFLSLSSSAQALYLHLSMNADDDGFCNQISTSMFKAHASIQDLQALLEKRYLYQFANGVIVIKHWRMANALRKDRYTPTNFQEELHQLRLKDNGAYTLVDNWLPDGCQVVAERLPQDRIDEDSIGKVNKEKSKKESLFSLFVDDYNISESLQAKLSEWLAYKTERKETYKEQGLKALLRKVENNAITFGDEAICDLIDECMANGWKGIIFDKLKKKEPEPIHSNSNASYDLDEFENRSLYGELRYKKK